MARSSMLLFALAGALFIRAVPMGFAQTEAVLTLDQALSEALARNPSLVVERNEIDIATGALRQARLYPFNPELELEGAAGRGRAVEQNERRGTNGIGVGLSQTIWLRGQRGFRIRGAEAGLNRAAALVQNVEREVVGDVLRAFSEVLIAQQRVALARDVVALATDVRDTAIKRFEANDVPQLDVFRAEVELSKVRNRLVAEERNLGTAWGELALLLGRPADQLIRAEAALSLPQPTGDLTSLQQTALEGRPDLMAAREAVRTAEAELALVKAERFFPELKVGFKYDEAREFDANTRTGQLALSLPLPLLNRRQGDVDRAIAELRKQEATIDLIRRRIEKEVASAYQQVLASRQIADAYSGRILPDQDRNFRLIREGYNLGELSITDVFVGQREFIDAREGYLDLVLTLNTATAALYEALNRRP